jgi:hypothetical protein
MLWNFTPRRRKLLLVKYTSLGTLLLVGLAAVLPCPGQTKMPAGWTETRPPVGSIWQNSELLCANSSRREWRVQSSDQVQIIDSAKEKPTKVTFPPNLVRTKDMLGRAILVKAGDGWLIGFNAGEFGGGLWWANADGSQTKPLSGENVQVIAPRGEELLVLTGLAHLSIDKGTVYSYRPGNGTPGAFVRIADLGSAPGAAMLQKNGTLLIATDTRVLKLSSDNRLWELYRSENMGFFYPHSIVADQHDTVFVGMRFYVLCLKRRTDETYDASWFVQSNCTRVKVKDFDCICIGDANGR